MRSIVNLTWLGNEYPFETTFVEKRDTILLLTFFGSLILVLLQPFGFSLIDQLQHSFGFFLIGILSTSINYFCLPYLFPRFFEERRWSILKAFLFLAFNYLFVGLWNHIYNILIVKKNIFLISSGPELFESLLKMMIIGLVASAFLILVRYNFLTRRHLQIAQDLSLKNDGTKKVTQVSKEASNLELNLEDHLVRIDQGDLRYVSAEGNYIALHLSNKGVSAPQLYRATMKEVEEQLGAFPEFFRCHRSFIINLNSIESSVGNSQGLFVKMYKEGVKIPVARPKIKLLRRCLKQNPVPKRQLIT